MRIVKFFDTIANAQGRKSKHDKSFINNEGSKLRMQITGIMYRKKYLDLYFLKAAKVGLATIEN